MNNEKIKATVLSYFTVILQILINIFLTPILIKAIGLDEYGLYQTINSLGSTLLLMNFGVTSIVSRNIVKCNKEGNKKNLENFLAMSVIVTSIIFILIIIIGIVLSRYINILYENTLTSSQIIKARYMFIYIVINLGIMSWHNYTSGIIIGNEKYKFSSFSKLLKQVIRVAILSILLATKINALSIVIVDLVVSITIVLTELTYCKYKIKCKIKYHNFDKKVLKEVFLFSSASLIQAVTNQINLSLDKVLLGIMTTTNVVAIYSIGMLIVNVMVSILQIISGFYLPDATKLVLEKADGEKLTNLIIGPGRIQSFIGCGIVFGFILIGKEFIVIWVGEAFKDVWLATIILLIFTMLSYVSSVANVILDAMLKKMARSLILIGTAILNVVLSIILVKKMGYFGAAIGTAFSMIIGNIILLNIYYKNKIKINIPRMYKEIFKGILISAIISFIIAYYIKLFFRSELTKVIISGITFVISYCLILIKFGLNNNELNIVQKYWNKIKNIFMNKETDDCFINKNKNT